MMQSQFDRKDRQILAALQKHGRISNLELADLVGLSATPCARRVKALEDSGVIAGYHAHLDAKKLGLTLMALVHVSMDKHTPERFERFEGVMQDCDSVLECFLITGQSSDYVVKVIVADMEAYQEFLLGTLTRIEGVTGVHSSFVMRQVINRQEMPT